MVREGHEETGRKSFRLFVFLRVLSWLFALQPAAAGAAWGQFRVAAHRQGIAFAAGFGRHAQQTLQFVAMAFGTIDLLPIEYQRFESMFTVLAGVFVHGHDELSSCKSDQRALAFGSRLNVGAVKCVSF